jgi:hypothetical protein
MDRRELAKRVEAGAQFLDTKFPGWPRQIALDGLEISHVRSCVLGQIYGDYGSGVEALCLGNREVMELGFFTSEHDHGGEAACREYGELRELWKQEVSRRRVA